MWQVAVVLTQVGNRQLWCGGTIITSKYIVSAAHCKFDRQGNEFTEEEFEVLAGIVTMQLKLIRLN